MPMEEDQEEQLTTIRVCLVMDPERTVSEVAKRGYERVMPVEIGMVSLPPTSGLLPH